MDGGKGYWILTAQALEGGLQGKEWDQTRPFLPSGLRKGLRTLQPRFEPFRKGTGKNEVCGSEEPRDPE